MQGQKQLELFDKGQFVRDVARVTRSLGKRDPKARDAFKRIVDTFYSQNHVTKTVEIISDAFVVTTDDTVIIHKNGTTRVFKVRND